MNKELFIEELNKLNIEVTDDKLTKLDKYYQLLVSENKLYNLTAITEETQVYLKHFYDSLTISKTINLTNEMAWNPWDSYNNYETYHNNIKTCLETAFNDESVTNGNFSLTVNAWQSEYFGQIYAEKIYVGQFDMSFGTISYSSKLDYYNEYLRLSSTNNISDGFNVNWSIDTSSLDDCIVYEGYKYLAARFPERIVMINGEQTKEEVIEEAKQIVLNFIRRR